MDKEYADYLRNAVSFAKSIYQKERNRESLCNYLLVRNLVKFCCDADRYINQANAGFEQVNQAFKDYEYLFRYFRKYLGKGMYSDMLYYAYSGLLSQEGAEKRDDLQRIAKKIDGMRR